MGRSVLSPWRPGLGEVMTQAAAPLFRPYRARVTFASALNFAIWQLNT